MHVTGWAPTAILKATYGMSLMFDVSTAGKSTQARCRGVIAKGQGSGEWELTADG